MSRAVVPPREAGDTHVGMKRSGLYRLYQYERNQNVRRVSWTKYGCI